MRETCTSGSVRGEGGNLLTYSARKGWVPMEDDPSAVGAAPFASVMTHTPNQRLNVTNSAALLPRVADKARDQRRPEQPHYSLAGYSAGPVRGFLRPKDSRSDFRMT
jgi:hypothetical protein